MKQRRRGQRGRGMVGAPTMTSPKTATRKRPKKPMGGSRTYGRLQRALDEAARREIAAALRETGGQVGAAAAALGISTVALWKRMRTLDIRTGK